MAVSRTARIGLIALGAGLATVIAADAVEANGLGIEGTFTTDRPCEGTLKELETMLVTITTDTIKHVDGLCTISNANKGGDTVTMRATCKDDAGTVLTGDLTLKINADKTMEMEDSTGSYAAVLHPCDPARMPK